MGLLKLKPSEVRYITKIEIPKFPLKVLKSKAAQAKYFSIKAGRQRVTKFPKYIEKGLKDNTYFIDLDKFVCDSKTRKRIIANPTKAGQPSYYIVNGQAFYSGFGSEFERMAIVSGLKDFYKLHLKRIKPFKNLSYPIIVDMEMHSPVNRKNWDLDNTWIHYKTISDSMVDLGILPDDNIQFITHAGSPLYYPVAHEDDRKLVLNFYADLREEVQQLKLDI